MKRILNIALTVLIVGFLATFIGYSAGLRGAGAAAPLLGSAEKSDSAPALKYHFAVITDNTGDAFWQSVRSGVTQAAQKYGAAVEFSGSLVKNRDEEIKDMQIATASRVDGIALYVTDRSRFTPLINKAVAQGIPVVTIESDDAASRRSAYVGPNSYSVGLLEANLAGQASAEWKSDAKAALILGGNYVNDNDARQALLSGFSEGLKTLPHVRLLKTESADSGYFGAELCIRDILSKYPGVNLVICTGTDDTLEVMQVLLDLNKTRQVELLGYGNTAQLRDYIRNGDLYGCVYEDGYGMGAECVEALTQCADGRARSGNRAYTGAYTLTRDNLVSYPGTP